MVMAREGSMPGQVCGLLLPPTGCCYSSLGPVTGLRLLLSGPGQLLDGVSYQPRTAWLKNMWLPCCLCCVWVLQKVTQWSNTEIPLQKFAWLVLAQRVQLPVRGRIRVGEEAGECSSLIALMEKLCYLKGIPCLFLMVNIS